MKCRILHESSGRIRVRMIQYHMTIAQADKLQYYLQDVEGVRKAKVNDRSCDVIVMYEPGKTVRDRIVHALSVFDYETSEVTVPEHTGRALANEYQDKMFFLVARRLITRFVIPAPISAVYTTLTAIPYIYKGLKTLAKKKIEVPVLDATSITVSLLRSDFTTAGSVIFLLKLGDLLEEWTHKKSVDDLAERMYFNIDKVWLKTDDSEVLVPVNEVKAGDLIVIRTGNVIPLDGVVESGEPYVNQASMTGESLPVHKEPGSMVYAGTVIDEGSCVVRVKNELGSGRYDRIVHMIEDSEKLKSLTENRAAHLADKLVPFSLGGTALTYALTRNVNKALAILMVDYSCALKLAMPISVLSAMRECSDYRISVKGGKFLEAVAEAQTIVFDKTGTLTYATPTVAEVIPFKDYERDEVLRVAACLEEHFPHSIANAVVEQAKKENLDHQEMHAKVEYVVAHGIVSTIDEKRAVIGSHHFVFEDENVRIPEGDEQKFEQLPDEYSQLFLAIDGELAAVLCIADPIRPDAMKVIRKLHEAGIDKVAMLTGDSLKTAELVAKQLGVDAFRGEVLPEDKAEFIRKEHEAGRKVIMIGDGINDAPALAEADAGIAIAAGAAIAQEVADITISADDLEELVRLRGISQLLMKRINRNYHFIMGFNSILIALGFFGVLQPTTTAVLHNVSTIGISLQSMTNLLEPETHMTNVQTVESAESAEEVDTKESFLEVAPA